MSDERTGHSARDKLVAVILVYENYSTVSQVCDQISISRTTWYEWEKQLKAAVQPIWGGLAKRHEGE